jgi:hypothetical protein
MGLYELRKLSEGLIETMIKKRASRVRMPLNNIFQ